jgi:hypothetical protein
VVLVPGVPLLRLGFVIPYLFREPTGTRCAWVIKPLLTAGGRAGGLPIPSLVESPAGTQPIPDHVALLVKFLATLIGGGSPALRREARWRAWCVALQRFMRRDGPVLAGFLRHAADFGGRGIANGYPATTVLGPPGRGPSTSRGIPGAGAWRAEGLAGGA